MKEVLVSTEIFVVMQGEYSDRRPIGMFSTRELAEQCVRVCSCPGHSNGNTCHCSLPDIEVFPLDLLAGPLSNGYRSYKIEMWMDGEVKCVASPAWPIEIGVFNTWSHFDSHDRWQIDWSGFARSEEHAIKICNDLRAYVIASGDWRQFSYEWCRTDLDGNPVEPVEEEG